VFLFELLLALSCRVLLIERIWLPSLPCWHIHIVDGFKLLYFVRFGDIQHHCSDILYDMRSRHLRRIDGILSVHCLSGWDVFV
jgi:hypothetical protein